MPDSVPGLVQLHAPLTVLAPGLLLLLAIPGLRLLPRARHAFSWLMLAVAVTLAALVTSSAVHLGAHWAMLPGGWVHAGTIAMAAATCAAAVGWRHRQPGEPPPLAALGAGYLQVIWSLPIAFAIAWDAVGWRRWLVVGGLCGGCMLGWMSAPAWGQALTALTVLAVAPRWRIQAGIAVAIAVAAVVFAEQMP